MEWQPIETAPKDGTVIWAVFYKNLYPDMHPGRPNMEAWNGVQVPIKYIGVLHSDFGPGWEIAAPAGCGGLPSRWIAGWMPLPQPPEGE